MKPISKHIYAFLAAVALVFLTGWTGAVGGCLGPLPIIIPGPSSCAVECMDEHMEEIVLNECGVPLQACVESCALEADSQGGDYFESCYSTNCNQTYQNCIDIPAESTVQCMLDVVDICPEEEVRITAKVNINLMKTLTLANVNQAFENMLVNTDAELSQDTIDAIDFALLGLNLDLLDQLDNRFRTIFSNIFENINFSWE